MKKTILITAFVFISFLSFGQTGPEDILSSFFKEYVDNPSKAVEEIYETNPWSMRIKDGIETMKNEVNKYTEDYVGKYYGYEVITKKQLGESFVLYAYEVKYDREPMRFTFIFYKPNKKWTLCSFKIDSDLDEELKDAAKIYNLNLEKEK
jgi:hypothetical protein